MTGAEVAALLRAALPGVPIARVRFTSHQEAVGPAVLVRMAGTDREHIVDGPLPPSANRFEIECRAPTGDGAAALGDRVLLALQPRLLEVLEAGDVDDNASLQRIDAFVFRLVVELVADL